MAEDLGVVLVAVAAGRAAAEELFLGQELLVDLEPLTKSDLRVVGLAHLGERLERERVFAHGLDPVSRDKGGIIAQNRG
jgi:hypothetical protein